MCINFLNEICQEKCTLPQVASVKDLQKILKTQTGDFAESCQYDSEDDE